MREYDPVNIDVNPEQNYYLLITTCRQWSEGSIGSARTRKVNN